MLTYVIKYNIDSTSVWDIKTHQRHLLNAKMSRKHNKLSGQIIC